MFGHFKRFGKQFIIYGIGDAINKAIVVLIVPLFTHYLSPSDYGVAAILVVTNSLIVGISDLGMTNSIARYYREEEDSKKSHIITTVQITVMLLTLMIAISGSLFSVQISSLLFKSASYSYLVILNLFTIPLTVAISPPMMRFRLNQKPKIYSAFNIAKAITGIGLNILFIIGLKRGIAGMFEANLLNAGLFALIIGGYSVNMGGIHFSKTLLKKLVLFGFPFMMGLVAFWVMDWSDRFLLIRMTNLSEVGLYNLGYSIGMAIMLPVGAFETAWPPFFMSITDQSNYKKIYSLILTYYVLIMAFIVILITVLAPDYFRLFTPSVYHQAYIVVPLVAFSYSLRGVFSIMAVGSFLKQRPVFQFASELIAMVLNIAIMFILIPRMGRIGAAWATAIAYMIMPVAIYLFSRKLFEIKYDFKRLAQIFLIGLGVYYVTKVVYQPTNLNLLIRLSILVLYPILLYLTGFFLDEEMKKIKLVIKKIFGGFLLRRKK